MSIAPPSGFALLPEDIYAALWLSALLVAAGQIAELFPADLELAAACFRLYAPEAKA